MHQQSQRPDSPSEQYEMYPEFEHDKRSTLNGYHRSSFTAIPNATRPSKHHATPSTMPSTNHNIYHDGSAIIPHDTYGLPSPTQQHIQPSFVEPSRSNYTTPFGLTDPYASYNKLPHLSQPHSLPHGANPHPIPMSSQTPYGPHLASNPASMSGNSSHNGGPNTNNANSVYEDISTIFVVGFPDDMQEREFQNMFTFSSGFEAATLKIPNKEYTAYDIGSTGNPTSALPGLQGLSPSSIASIVRAQAAINDPYNIVTMNQGGVIVDGGRDGTMASWPAVSTGPMDDSYYPPGLGIGLGGLSGVGGPSNVLTLGPNPNPSASGTASGPMSNNGPLPPRKQIIGFAKFRSREEALEAKHVLQGRRVDIEKGAVLKAEMAKKNLHTKRGVTANGGAGSNVGSVNLMGSGLGPNLGSTSLPSGNGMSFTNGAPQYEMYPNTTTHSQGSAELGGIAGMSTRERELGTLGAMGFSAASNGTSSTATVIPSTRDSFSNHVLPKLWADEGRERDRMVHGATGIVSSGDESSGPISAKEGGRRRSEAQREDVERDHKQPLRLRSGSAFDAFHSVPVSSYQGGMVSPPIGRPRPLALSSSLTHDDATAGPWDHFAKPVSSDPPSSSKDSQSSNEPSRSSRSSSVAAGSTHSLRSMTGMFSAEDDEDIHTNPEMEAEDPNATAKEIDVAQIARAVGSLALNTSNGNTHTVIGSNAINGANSQGNTSPDLPSPSSGSGTSISALSASGAAAMSSSSSSSSLRHAPASSCPLPLAFTSPNSTPGLSHLSSILSSTLVSGVDQNPPINTLYVGNLPISPPPLGYPPDILEDSLRELFRTRPGYRRLSFKQKSTGPMCFVEFEDVNAATKTINELYGNTLNGLVKGGGIRLSYSKNPLGVRTPTSANGPGPGIQQQHIQQQAPPGRDAERERGGYGVQALSPTPHHHSANHRPLHTHEYMISPPPPRFAGTSAGANPLSNMAFGNFSASFNAVPSNVPTGSASSNFMFGTANHFQGNTGPGVGYRLTSADSFADAQGQGLGAPFAPFDGHLDHHPQMPQMTPLTVSHQGPNLNQNQNF